MEEGKKKGASGLAVASLVFGILAIVNSFIPVINFISYIFAIIAIIFGIIGIASKRSIGIGVAGLVLGVISLLFASSINSAFFGDKDVEVVNGTTVNTKTNETIKYTSVSIDEMESALENNAASAKELYNGKYLEISGRLGTIDSDLYYISLVSPTDSWDLIGIHCTLKNQNVKDTVKSLSKDQNIIVRGKITDVGEILGYYLDTYEIIAQ